MHARLKHPYVSVPVPGGSSYGGSQMWSKNRTVRKCGCGPVAAFDLLLYLQANGTESISLPQSREEYCRGLETLQRRYFPLLYPLGISGILLVLGLNRVFRDRALPYHAVWGMTRKMLNRGIYEMLENDIPVILAVGSNFPFFWEKHCMTMYREMPDALPPAPCKVRSHFVTVTEADNELFQLASWGKKYSVRISDFEAYVRAYSNTVISNIVYVTKKKN